MNKKDQKVPGSQKFFVGLMVSLIIYAMFNYHSTPTHGQIRQKFIEPAYQAYIRPGILREIPKRYFFELLDDRERIVTVSVDSIQYFRYEIGMEWRK